MTGVEIVGLTALIGFIGYAVYSRNLPVQTTDKKATNPWMIIGWIVLICVILALGFCGMVAYNLGKAEIDRKNGIDPVGEALSNKAYESPKNLLFAKQIAIECTNEKVGATIQNVGSFDIRFAKGFFHLKNKKGSVIEAKDNYFSPSTIPPGSSASVDIYPSGKKFDECVLVSIQDTDGTRVSIE